MRLAASIAVAIVGSCALAGLTLLGLLLAATATAAASALAASSLTTSGVTTSTLSATALAAATSTAAAGALALGSLRWLVRRQHLHLDAQHVGGLVGHLEALVDAHAAHPDDRVVRGEHEDVALAVARRLGVDEEVADLLLSLHPKRPEPIALAP